MNAYQLSLFGETTPVNNHKPRNYSRQQQTHTIQCTTEQAAILMEISKSTLYSARKQGKTYQNNGWTARSLCKNSWLLTHSSH